jgi:hypothetical protein
MVRSQFPVNELRTQEIGFEYEWSGMDRMSAEPCGSYLEI